MKSKIILIAITLFILSLAVHYFPIHKKGYSFSPMGGDLTIARNLALTGEYKMESEKNVVLSSIRVKEEGIYSNTGNRLNTYIYGWIFKNFGFKQELPLYLSIFLWAIAGLILFFVVLKLFNLKTAAVFGLIHAFMPVLSQGALMGGFYEWPVLFFSLGLLSYFWPQLSKKKNKKHWFNLILASVLFALAALAKNSFVVSFPSFFIYDFWKNRSLKRASVLALPFVLIFGGSLVWGYLSGLPSAYLSAEDTDFSRYGHLYPDPYTYHFEKEEYLQSVAGTDNVGYNWFLEKYGYPVSFKNKMLRYWHVIKFYPKEIVKLIVSGGPLILLFLIAGLVYLYRKRKSLFAFFSIWGIVWYALLISFKSANWDHFLEIGFLITLLTALGATWLINFILRSFLKERTKYLIIGIFLLSLIGHFVLANKWMLHEEYNTSQIALFREMAGTINQNHLDKQNDVVAIDVHPTFQGLNYYTDISLIYFNPATIRKLLDQNNLSWAFEQFGVTKIIGFDDNLTEEIVRQTGIKSLE